MSSNLLFFLVILFLMALLNYFKSLKTVVNVVMNSILFRSMHTFTLFLLTILLWRVLTWSLSLCIKHILVLPVIIIIVKNLKRNVDKKPGKEKLRCEVTTTKVIELWNCNREPLVLISWALKAVDRMWESSHVWL